MKLCVTTTAVEGGSRSCVLMSLCPRNYIKITYINSRAHLTAIWIPAHTHTHFEWGTQTQTLQWQRVQYNKSTTRRPATNKCINFECQTTRKVGKVGESGVEVWTKWGKGKQVEPFRAISLGSQWAMKIWKM